VSTLHNLFYTLQINNEKSCRLNLYNLSIFQNVDQVSSSGFWVIRPAVRVRGTATPTSRDQWSVRVPMVTTAIPETAKTHPVLVSFTA
jgi:hypothetical protein